MNEIPETVTLAVLARSYLDRCDGDTVAATAKMQLALEADGDLLRTVIKAAVHDAVKTHVGQANRHNRASIIATTTSSGREGVVALANGITRALLDMPLSNGLKLREATRGQVLEQADRYSAQANDMGRKARWLTLIAQHVPDDKTVGRAMTDKRAAELWAEVSSEKEAA